MRRVVSRLLVATTAVLTILGAQTGMAQAATGGTTLLVTTTGLPSAAEGTAYRASLESTGGAGPVHWSVTSGTLPTGLGLASNGQISGIVRGSTSTFVVTATDGSQPAAQTASAGLTITVTAAPTLVVTTTTAISATQGAALHAALDASGGTPPYQWTAVGPLPAGLSLSADGTLGGTPTGSGDEQFGVEVTDSRVPTAQTANALLTVDVQPAPTLSVTSAALPGGTVGQGYGSSLIASGIVGTATWSIAAGSLPPGLQLSATGQVTGTPIATGTFSFTAAIADGATPASRRATATLSIVVGPASPVAITSTLPLAQQGRPYDVPLAAAGGTGPYTWSVTAGSLPAGLELDATEGRISGTPMATGSFDVTLGVADASAPQLTASEPQVLVVQAAPALSVTTSSLPDADQGVRYSEAILATGGTGSDTWTVVSGSTPSGIDLTSAGRLDGTPTGSGISTFTVEVTDDASPIPDVATATLSVAVDPAPALQVTTTSLSEGVVGQIYAQQLGATGGVGGDTWSVTAGNLPSGVVLDDSGDLYGRPMTPGSFAVTVTVTDAATPAPDVVTVALTLVVAPALALAVATPTLPAATAGAYYDQTLEPVGGIGPYSWSVKAGALPQGMNLDPSGRLDGYPTDSGSFPLTFQVTDSATPVPVVASVTVTLIVAAAPALAIAGTAPDVGTVGQYYPGNLTATGGVGPYTWSVSAGALPPGVGLYPDGYFYGTPTAAGTFNFTAEVTDSATPVAAVASAPVTLTVTAAPALAITAAALPQAGVGQSYYWQLQANGGMAPYTWSLASGTLPDGLAFDGYGELYGTPTTPGVFSFTVEVTDAETPVPVTRTLSVTLHVAPTGLFVTTTSLPGGTQGTGYYGSLQASGGVSSYTWSTSGTLPAGLFLTAGGGLYGTPTAAGTFTFPVSVTDSAVPPASATGTVTVTIAPAPPLAIITTSLPGGTQGTSYDGSLQASGGVSSYTWSTSGTLPAGLFLTAGGGLYGTPTAAGTFTFPVSVTDSAVPPASATGTVTVTIAPAPPLAIITTSLPGGTQGTSYDGSLQASGGVGGYTWSVLAGALPTGVGLASYGWLEGTPTATGVFTFTVQIAGSGDLAAVQTLSLAIGPSAPLVVTTTTLTGGVQGQPYDAELSSSGGVGTEETWSVAGGQLPPGLTLWGSGELTGEPTGPGTFDFVVSVSDGATPRAQTAARGLSITVTPAASLSIETSVLPPAVEGGYYAEAFEAAGGIGTDHWSVTSGQLPTGLTLRPDGELAGYPQVTGSFPFVATATDSATPTPATAGAPLTLTVGPGAPLSLPAANLPPAVQGDDYTQALEATGGLGPDTWSLASGTLPPGLTLGASGTLDGKPTASGTYEFTAEVTDSTTPTPQVATGPLSVTVARATPLTTTTALPAGTAGEYYFGDLTAQAGVGPYTWSLASGTLPPGVGLGADGELSGEPTTSGSYTFSAAVTDSATPTPDGVTVTATVTVFPPPALAIDTSLPTATVGLGYDGSVYVYGGIGPYTWSLASGTLPPGVGLGADGELSGEPTTSGSYTFSAAVTDSATPAPDVDTVTATITVSPAEPLEVTTSPVLPTIAAGDYENEVLTATGGIGPYTWSLASGTLPPGVVLDGVGQLTGTLTTAGQFSFTVEATDSATPVPATTWAPLTLMVGPANPLAVTTVGLPAGTAGAYYDASLTATGGIGPYTWSVATGTLPPGLALASGGYLDGVLTAAGTYQLTLEVTDSSQPSPEVAPVLVTLTVAPPGPLLAIASTLPPATVGTYYDAYLSATGGIAPYTWAVSVGSLPDGLALLSDGVLEGTPSASGNYQVTLAVTDSSQPTPEVVTVTAALAVGAATPLAVTTTTLSTASTGEAYEAELAASGGTGPYAWSMATGELPPGLTLAATGILSGFPTAAGTYHFTVAVTDSASPTADVATKALALSLGPAVPLAISTPRTLTATAGEYLFDDLTAAGGIGPYTWSVATGSLPPGMTLDPSGQLAGTPTASGAYTMTVEVTDSATPVPAVAAAALTVAVAPPAPLVVNNRGPLTATAGSLYVDELTATGGVGPYTWSLTAGSLPKGLTLDAGGGLFGQPSGSGTFPFTVQVTDSATPVPAVAAAGLTITVAPAAPLAVGTTALPSGVAGSFYDTSLQATGGVGPYTWSLTAGSLPGGVTLDPGGTVSGYPTASGTFPLTVQVTDSSTPVPAVATMALTLDLTTAGVFAITTPGTLPAGSAGIAYDEVLAATGGMGPYAWSVVSGSLPGLTLGPSGKLSGVPAMSGDFTFTVEATDSAMPTPGVATAVLSLHLGSAGPLTIGTVDLMAGTAGRAYTGYLIATGGIGPYTWSLATGSLPGGLTLEPWGELVGTPTAAGTFAFTVEVTDSATPTPGVATLAVAVDVGPSVPFAITTSTLPPASAGTPYRVQLRDTGGTAPYAWSVQSGSLPPGLTLDSSGVLSGVPSTAGEYSFTVGVTDSAAPPASATPVALALAVDPPRLVAEQPDLPVGNAGTAYAGSFPVGGGTGPYSWSVVGGTLPAGLTINSGTGQVAGVPTTSGVRDRFSVEITDAGTPPQVVVASATITVAPASLAFTATALSSVTVGVPVAQSLGLTGGIAPYTWAVTGGALPAGLSLSADGRVTGTPAVVGASAVTVTATDGSWPVPATLSEVLSLTVGPAPAVTSSTAGVATGAVGQPYHAALVATGGVAPYGWTIDTGSFPPGLSLDRYGAIVGTPTAAGTFAMTLEVADSQSSPDTALQPLVLHVAPVIPLALVATAIPPGAVGMPYPPTTLTAVDGLAPYTWSVVGGALPPGLTLDGTTGTLSGAPTVGGTFAATVAVADSEAVPATATQTLSFTVAPASTSTSVVASAATVGTGQPEIYTATVTSLTSPAAPTGTVQFDDGSTPIEGCSSVALAGTAPHVATCTASYPMPGSHSITAHYAGDFSTAASTSTPVVVNSVIVPLAITTASLPTGTAGSFYRETLAGTGGSAPYTWSVTGGALPPGLTLDAASGTLTGTPSSAGAYALTVSVTDAETTPVTVSRPFVMTVVRSLSWTGVYASVTTVVPGQLVTYTATVEADAPPTGTVDFTDGSIPVAACQDVPLRHAAPYAATCTLSYSGAGTHAVTAVYAGDVSTDPSTSLPAEVKVVSPLAVSTTSLSPATVGSAYPVALQATGGVPPYTWAVTGGSLPPGLRLEGSTGVVDGTPTTSGTFPVTVTVTDSGPGPDTAVADLSISVASPQPLGITTATVPGASLDLPYFDQMVATGGTAPYAWSLASGTLPAGLTLNGDGTLQGIPTVSGTADVQVEVTDSTTPTPGTATVALAIVVGPAGPSAEVAMDPPDGTVPLTTGLVVVATQADGNPLDYAVDFGDGSPTDTGTIDAPYTPLTVDHDYATAGAFTARVTVVDTISDLSTSVTAAVEVAAVGVSSPSASLAATALSGVAPFNSTFDVGGSDPSGRPLRYTLDFGDGSTSADGTVGVGTSVDHQYSEPGSYAAVLTVDDGLLEATSLVHVQVVPPTPVAADAGDDQVVTVGDDVEFDGSGSQPAGAIDRYSWEFGDGISAQGMDVDHVYQAAGTYTARLTVTSGGSSASSTTTITVDPLAPPSLDVDVTGDGAPVAGAEVLVLQGDGQQVSAISGADGTAALRGLTDGSYTAYVEATGFLPTTVEATVAGGAGSASADLTGGSLAQATVTSTRLDYDQILAAGIDPDTPANHNVFKFSINLAFVGGPPAFDGYLCGDRFCGDTGFGIGGGTGGGTGGGGYRYCTVQYCLTPSPATVDGEPMVQWLVIPGTASFLKEFFQVQMVVTDLATTPFDLTHGSATLQLPPGLSLAPTAAPQSLTQTVTDIPGGNSAAVDWIVRGDTEGTYDLTATYAGLLQPFGTPVALEAITKTPLKVWGASAVTMTVDADATVTADYPYNVRVGLTNVSDIPVYNAAVALTSKGGVGYIFQPRQQLDYSTPVIEPGQTFYTPYYVLVPQVTGSLDLAKSFVKQTGGNVSLASTIVTHTTVDPPDKAPSLNATPLLDGIGLSWAPVSGATEYDIYSTPTPETPFGTTPVGEVGAGTTTYVVGGVDPNAAQYYVVSSIVDGTPTMDHPMVAAKASTVSTEPVTTVNAGSGCGASARASVTFSDGFDDLTSWSYQIGTDQPVVKSLAGRTGSGLVIVPLSEIGAGVQLTIQGSDTLGKGPKWTTELGESCSYVALGDSFSSGEGAPDGTQTGQTSFRDSNIYDNAWLNPPDYTCDRSTLSYPYLLSTKDPSVRLSLLAACSGAWTTDVDPALQPLGRSFKTLDGEGYQLDAPQVADADIVSLSSGGNDLGFGPVLGFCVTATDCENYFSLKGAIEGKDLLDVDISDLYAQLVSLYEDTETAAPQAQIYVMDYPYLFDTDKSNTCDGIQSDEAAWFTAKEDDLDNVIGDAVNAADSASATGGRVHYVDVRNAFDPPGGTDHRLCSPSENAVNGLDLSDVDLSFHPNAYGYRLEEPYLQNAILNPPSDPYHTSITSLGSFQPLLKTTSNKTAAVEGALYTVIATGFKLLSPVTISIFSNPITLGVVSADANGDVSSTVTIPDLSEGFHTLVLQGIGPDGSPITEYQSIDVSSPGPLSEVTSTLPPAVAGTAYPMFTLAASGGTLPLTWSIASGSLPAGMGLDPSTGIVDGMPTAAGRYSFTVEVTDAEAIPATATQTLSITVTPAVTSTAVTGSARTVAVGQAVTYTATVQAPVVPTGTVDFGDGPIPIASCQHVVLSGTAPYTAICTVTYPVAGAHSVTARYSGDSSSAASVSPGVTVTVTSSPPASTPPSSTPPSSTPPSSTQKSPPPSVSSTPSTPDGKGYWLVASDGGIFAFGDAAFYGSTGAQSLNKPIVGMTSTPDGKGYWLVASDGGIFAFGDAAFYGSTGAQSLNKPIVGMTSTPDGKGYWLVASDGGIFAFGDAAFYGSTGAQSLNKPIVGMTSTPDGKGYWLVASDGGIFAFGDAAFYGSTGAQSLNKPIVGMTSTPDGKGYWLVASDGGIFAFGDAAFYGSTGAQSLNKPIVGMTSTPDGKGYWLVASDGGIFAFGDAAFYGSTGAQSLNKPIMGMVGA